MNCRKLKVVLSCLAVFLAIPLLLPALGWCAELPAYGKTMPIFWVVPFICMLLSIAVFPLTAPHFWEHNFGKIAVFWGLAFLVPFAVVYGMELALHEFLHAILTEYLPFIILLFALYTVSGGIRLTGRLVGTPLVNTGILVVGTFLASWMGTTGAAMLLIRPLLRANAHRKYKVHSVVFFIFLVANIGGCLTPLGDPPLFLGFLQGVSFFWTATHLLPLLLFMVAILVPVFFIIDTVLYAKEGKPQPKADPSNTEKLGFDGKINFILLLGVIASVLMSGTWKPNHEGISVYHIPLALPNLVRDALLLIIAALSLKLTRAETRRLNNFNWGPIAEVGKLFLGIFISMIPAIAILRAGAEGALSGVINLVSKDGQPINFMYFWLTGALSSFLDNAPTYLVFFNTAGGNAVELMGNMAATLTVISAGAVFMGANTYIGNAPNFMVRSIAEDQGVKMPSFFGYMAWSVGILVPVFALMTFLFFI